VANRKQRLDRLLVERGLASSERVAQSLIMNQLVLVDDQVVTKPGTAVRLEARLRVRGSTRKYASRGGEKLEAALTAFGVSVSGRVALDAGASTGGFTDCLLSHGAARVFSVDVGYGQLHSRLINDPRVTVMERTNISDLSPASLGGIAPTICTVDLSYLSLTKAVPTLEAVIADDAVIICLIKPLFEGLAEKDFRDPPAIRQVLLELLPALERVARRKVVACCASPITGTNGSIEFLGLLAPQATSPAHEVLLNEALADAAHRHGLAPLA
jgi:23S rRNA (cytidine1920-2'-O)/16S rRNA (cytidine1409-2'-O)-methyltransferase